MSDTETVEQFLARGGKVRKFRTYDIKKFSSIPKAYKDQKGLDRRGLKKVANVDPQALLDAAMGTDLEAHTIVYLESIGYKVS